MFSCFKKGCESSLPDAERRPVCLPSCVPKNEPKGWDSDVDLQLGGVPEVFSRNKHNREKHSWPRTILSSPLPQIKSVCSGKQDSIVQSGDDTLADDGEIDPYTQFSWHGSFTKDVNEPAVGSFDLQTVSLRLEEEELALQHKMSRVRSRSRASRTLSMGSLELASSAGHSSDCRILDFDVRTDLAGTVSGCVKQSPTQHSFSQIGVGSSEGAYKDAKGLGLDEEESRDNASSNRIDRCEKSKRRGLSSIRGLQKGQSMQRIRKEHGSSHEARVLRVWRPFLVGLEGADDVEGTKQRVLQLLEFCSWEGSWLNALALHEDEGTPHAAEGPESVQKTVVHISGHSTPVQNYSNPSSLMEDV